MEDTNQRIPDGANDDYYSDIEEYEYEERSPLSFRSTLQKLKQNDPTVTELGIVLNTDYTKDFFNNIDWKEDGDCISDNKHLKKHISFYNNVSPEFISRDDKHRQQLQDFFSCVYRNSSINHILMYSYCILDDFGGSLIEGLSDHCSLTKLEICGQSRKGNIGRGYTAIGKVLNHPASKVKDLEVSNCKCSDDSSINTIFDSLLGSSTLKRLSFNRSLSSVGLRALSNVIRDPRCKLARLSLRHANINDEGGGILGSALCGSSSVKVLDLSLNRSITSAGWRTLLNKLSKVSLVSLDLGGNDIDDNGGMSALVNIGTLKSLKISSNHSMSPTGWQTFFNSVRIGGTQLVKLDISDTNIGNIGFAALGSMISNMSTLKTLSMMDIGRLEESIVSQDWISFFNTLHGSNLDLINLFLGEYRVDDDGIQDLARLISRMSSLKWLSLGLINRSVTPFGWQVLIDYLQSPNFALKQLDIGDNNINDDTLIAFTRALVRNNTLKLLHLYQDPEDFEDGDMITERGWEALSTLLCNSSSTMDTYNSHHMLQDLTDDYNQYDDEMNLPDKLVTLLELNRNKDKKEVARQKILQTHFSGTTNVQEFLGMELEIMPTAISWIGRPTPQCWWGTNVSGLSTLYNVTRRVPDLFDSSAQKKKSGAAKRKCSDIK